MFKAITSLFNKLKLMESEINQIDNTDLIKLLNRRRDDYFLLVDLLESSSCKGLLQQDINNARDIYVLMTKLVYKLQGKDL